VVVNRWHQLSATYDTSGAALVLFETVNVDHATLIAIDVCRCGKVWGLKVHGIRIRRTLRWCLGRLHRLIVPGVARQCDCIRMKWLLDCHTAMGGVLCYVDN